MAALNDAFRGEKSLCDCDDVCDESALSLPVPLLKPLRVLCSCVGLSRCVMFDHGYNGNVA